MGTLSFFRKWPYRVVHCLIEVWVILWNQVGFSKPSEDEVYKSSQESEENPQLQ